MRKFELSAYFGMMIIILMALQTESSSDPVENFEYLKSEFETRGDQVQQTEQNQEKLDLKKLKEKLMLLLKNEFPNSLSNNNLLILL
jgi:hypothetical protein